MSGSKGTGNGSGRTWLPGALHGAALGAALFLVEALAVAWHDTGLAGLGLAGAVGWIVGAILGAVVGGCAASTSAARGGARAVDVCRAGRTTLLLLGALVFYLQIGHRLLASFVSLAGLALFALVGAGAAAALFIAWRTRIGSGAKTGARVPLSLGVLAATAIAALVLPAWLGGAFDSGADMTPWKPAHAAAADAGAGPAPRLLLIGLDGVRWESLEPELSAGRLPNLAALVARGARGILRADLSSGDSPTLWTNIMTGRPVEQHGVRSNAGQRQVKALWQILESVGWPTVVANVPGSYPADGLRGGMLAGWPLPGANPPNLGWRLTTAGGTDPRGPVEFRLPRSILAGESVRVVLRAPSVSRSALEETAAWIVLEGISPWTAKDSAKRLWAFGAPCLGRSQLRLDLRVERTGSAAPRLVGSAADSGAPLFSIARGEWSPWLVDDEEEVVRLRVNELDDERVEVFATSLFRRRAPFVTNPAELLDHVESCGRPWIHEGTGSAIFYDDASLEPLAEHQRDIAEAQVAGVLELMRERRAQAYVDVITVTERIHHPFWKFREPEPFLALADRHPLYKSHGPRADQIRRFGGEIDATYRAVDHWIGELLANTDPSTVIAVVSDHGHQAGHNPNNPTYGIHHEEGIYLIAGPGVHGPGRTGPVLEQADLLPLLLAHLGLPQAKDLPGSVPAELWPTLADGTSLPLPAPIATWEDGSAAGSGPAIDARELEEQLHSLGYTH